MKKRKTTSSEGLQADMRRKRYRERAARRGDREILLQLPAEVVLMIDQYRDSNRIANRSRALVDILMQGVAMKGVNMATR